MPVFCTKNAEPERLTSTLKNAVTSISTYYKRSPQRLPVPLRSTSPQYLIPPQHFTTPLAHHSLFLHTIAAHTMAALGEPCSQFVSMLHYDTVLLCSQGLSCLRCEGEDDYTCQIS